MELGIVDWADAACLGFDQGVFFDDDGVELARKTCLSCPIRQACLDEALSLADEYGVRGGLTADERRYIAATRIPKAKLVVAACACCDEPVTWRLSPIPAAASRTAAGRFRLADGLLVVGQGDLRRPVIGDEARCDSCGRVIGWVDDRTGDVGLELERLTVRSPAPARRPPVRATAAA